ncbi:MAG: alpha-L-rhamnosidase C-terminal domain-containing protein [Clostridiales bacterium]|nr:alpha-L-rhamnosidase C-terminal domain-containing protein [Clostridiales bacterium]
MYSKDSKWISFKGAPCDIAKIYYFKRIFDAKKGLSLIIRVSADSRYKLYFNGRLVSTGPCKGNEWTTYYETVDLSSYIKDGRNVIAAEVMHLPDVKACNKNNMGLCGVARTSKAAFLLDGVVADQNGTAVEDICTDGKWYVKQVDGIKFISPVSSVYACIFEKVDCNKADINWKKDPTTDGWSSPEILGSSFINRKSSNLCGELTFWYLKERPIPKLYRTKRRFLNVTNTNFGRRDLNGFINDKYELKIPPNKCIFFELDAGELTTGYIRVRLKGGDRSSIKIIYSECYFKCDDGKYKKGIRDDISGVIIGDYDIINVGRRKADYETFWFRTFRFIRVEVKTGADGLTLQRLDYDETGYPLIVKGNYESSDATHTRMWDVSIRTLKRCMHETYEDCPYYEQLQYSMDSRQEILFTYQISNDDRLAQKCIEDFHSSLMPFGLLQSRYPSEIRQIIPGFSLHWIFMLHDYLMYRGDIDFVKKYRPTVDAILGWFDRHLTKQGIVGQTGYWPFVDWVDGWDLNSVPPANRKGPITVYSLMYASALQKAAEIFKVTGRKDVSKEYLLRSRNILNAVKEYCWDNTRGMLKDGPDVYEFSQHTQIWAVLSGLCDRRGAKDLLLRTMKMDIPKASYAMSFYLFRALEIAGLYDRMDELLDKWRDLLDLNLTTWVEDPVNQRSDCHGWGALPLYEFPAVILGVKPKDAGYKVINISPHICNLKYAKGHVCTKFGMVFVSWNIDKNRFYIKITSPANIEKEIILPDGKHEKSYNAKISLECDLI